MFNPLDLLRTGWNLASTGASLLASSLPVGIKTLKYFVDSTFRDQVVPVPGSVLYCDLWVAVEHSGIYVGDGVISNIEVDGIAESSVARCGPDGFTSKSKLGRKIYVSCDRDGAVGHARVARGADGHVGERAFYGLVFKNCHVFSAKCVHYAGEHEHDVALTDRLLGVVGNETWEPTMGALKRAARRKLGATKWRLWDWNAASGQEEPTPEPDWQAHEDYFRNRKLDADTVAQLRRELEEAQAYEAEIADENVPAGIRQRLASFRTTLATISDRYEQVKDFLAQFPGAGFSYADLAAADEDVNALARTMQDNERIRELVRRMGRDYIAEEKKRQVRVPRASRNEVHGTHRSDDLMRMLPSELLNLEDETLEVLFHARLLEKNLLSYELQGKSFAQVEQAEQQAKRTGPVVACLDTSASMQGAPLLKARALLLAIARILDSERRSLHVLLFGASGEVREFSLEGQGGIPGLLRFLRQGFGGGTDFETPLQRALAIVDGQAGYRKADVLMVSDGDCSLSPGFVATLQAQKRQLDCMVYSVLCAGTRVEDGFSDEVFVL